MPRTRIKRIGVELASLAATFLSSFRIPRNTSPNIAIQLYMLQFVCDYCQNVKLPEEVWITGMAAENVGTKAARREVVIDPTWRRERAVQPFAVHFCCIECKDRYLAELFQKPAALLEIEEVDVVPDPAARVIHSRKKPVAGRTTKSRTTTVRTRKR